MTTHHDEAMSSLSDDLLMRQFFELTLKGGGSPGDEAARLESVVYARLARAYGESIPEQEVFRAA